MVHLRFYKSNTQGGEFKICHFASDVLFEWPQNYSWNLFDKHYPADGDSHV